MKRVEGNRGYIIAEAAMLVPVFLFSVVLLIYMVKIMHFQEIVHFESAEKLASLSWESQLGGSSFGERMYESRVYHGVQEKVEKEINICAKVEENEDVYVAEITYPIELELPFGLFDDIRIRDVIVARKWSGTEYNGDSPGFSYMEQADDGEYVYIFPRYGERYHKGYCSHLFIEGRYFEGVYYNYALSKGYIRCGNCY